MCTDKQPGHARGDPERICPEKFPLDSHSGLRYRGGKNHNIQGLNVFQR